LDVDGTRQLELRGVVEPLDHRGAQDEFQLARLARRMRIDRRDAPDGETLVVDLGVDGHILHVVGADVETVAPDAPAAGRDEPADDDAHGEHEKQSDPQGGPLHHLHASPSMASPSSTWTMRVISGITWGPRSCAVRNTVSGL